MSKFNQYLRLYNEIKNLNTEKKEFEIFFDVAMKVAEKKSTCGRKHVGAAIFYWADEPNEFNLKKYELVSTGWNGFPEKSGETRYGKEVMPQSQTCKDKYDDFAKMGIDKDSDEGRALHLIIMKDEIHAEDRAIQNAIEKYNDKILRNCSIFTTLSPCVDCSEEIKKYGIAVGGWKEKYSRDKGAGIKLINKILLGDKKLEF